MLPICVGNQGWGHLPNGFNQNRGAAAAALNEEPALPSGA